MHVYALHTCLVPASAREGIYPWHFRQSEPHGHCGLNLGPLKEQPILLTIKPPLQPQKTHLFTLLTHSSTVLELAVVHLVEHRSLDFMAGTPQ